MTTSLSYPDVKDRSITLDKNLLPTFPGVSVYAATDLIGQVFPIKGFRELALIGPAALQADGVTAIEVQVSITEDGDFGVPADFPDFTTVAATIGFFQTGVVLAPWNYGKIVLVGAHSLAHNLPFNLT